MAEPMCADCGGWDVEWMRKCQKHNLEYCRGCSCPGCDEEAQEDEDLSYDEAMAEHAPTAIDFL